MTFLRIFLAFFSLYSIISMPLHGTSCCCSFLSNARLELGYSAGEYIFLRQNYAEMGLFVPVILEDWAPFVDARAYRFDNGRWGASSGLGIRYSQDNERILGANAYYDYRRGNHRGSFHRLGLGAEWLGDCWDIRVNGYIPLGRQSHSSRLFIFDKFTGGFRATCRQKEFCFSGFEAEFGLPLLCWCDFNVYGAFGSYYFHGHDRRSNWGEYVRLDINWRTYLSLQTFTSYDRHNHVKFQGRVLLSIPFEMLVRTCDICNICENLLTQSVYRHGTIFTDRCCSFTWNWKQTKGD